MSKTSLQYRLDKKGGSFTEASVPHPTPGPDDIYIRTKAVAVNPVDWKNRSFGAIVQSWPAVFGIDAAGVVDSVEESARTSRAETRSSALAEWTVKESLSRRS